jgi:Carboxypeptidase regulatory-like domain
MSATTSIPRPRITYYALNFSLHRLGICFIALLLTVAGLAGSVSRAQEFRGTISGSVADSTGAVVAGASVIAKENQTGTVNRTVSDSSGQYVVPFLAPGDYTITATLAGFKSETRTGITLQSQEHPIINLTLAVGEATETVTVSGAAPLIDQANASVGQVISTQSVADLPLNGRTPTTFTELSVGVITTAAPQLVHPFDNNAGNAWSIGGTPNQVSEVLLDGSPDLTLLGALAYAPTQDSVQEVSVRPFDTDASFGHTIGGVINQITKSGTNRIHGTAYEFNQIPNLDGNLWFNSRITPVPKLPVTHYNQYGLTVGGPIFIPKVYDGKDKLFFFFAFEGLKDSQPVNTTTTVPTTTEKTGDFSQLLTAGCAGYTVNSSGQAICPGGANDAFQFYNPFTAALVGGKVVRTPIANNNLAALGHTFDPAALAYLKLYPAANATAAAAADGQNNYISNAPSADTYNNEFGRMDYNLNSRDHIFFDMRHNNRTQTKNNYFANNTTGTTLTRENFGATLDNVVTLNATTILDTRINWTEFKEAHGTQAQAYGPASVGLPTGLAASSTEVQLPMATFGSCGSFTSFQCLGDTSSAIDPTTSYQAFTDIVKVLGRHTLKVGFDGRQYRLSVQNFGASSGSFTFTNGFVTDPAASLTPTFGGDMADFMFGLPNSGTYDLNVRSDYHQYYFGSFVQDDWRVNDRLSVNLGLRFDIDTPFREKAGKTVNGFNPTAPNTASGAKVATPLAFTNGNQTVAVSSVNALGGLTFPSPTDGAVYATNNGFLSPRFGFSYSLDSKTVIRGGFGIFVQPETLASLASTGTYSSNALSNSEGFSATTNYTSSTNAGVTPPTANPLSNPFPGGFVLPAGSSAGASTFLGGAVSFLAPKQHDPYSERYDLGVQRSVTNSTLVEILYQGNHSLHLPIASQNLNAVQKQYLSTTPYRNQSLSYDYANVVANPFSGLLPNGGSANSSTVALSNLIVPYPQFGTAAVSEQNQTIGQSYFNSVIFHVEQRAKHGLTLTANYSFNKLIEADTFLNDEDTIPTRRISPFDHTHHFTAGATYNLPFGKGKMFAFGGSKLANELLGGFVLNGIYQFQSGQPLVFTNDLMLAPGVQLRQIGNQPRNTNTTASGNPALSINSFVTGTATVPTVAACNAAPTSCDGTQFVNNGSYVNHYRTLPQTLSWVRQDGFNNMDASILKNFALGEGAYLQLRFETFNTLNHPVFGPPVVSSSTTSTFGSISSVISNSLPRQIQLGARIVF